MKFFIGSLALSMALISATCPVKGQRSGTAAMQPSQASVDSVKQVVNQLFAAMKNADTLTLKAAFSDNAILQTILTGKDGQSTVRTEAPADFSRVIGTLAKGDADERIQFDVVEVDDALAIVWAPYSFYFKGKFSHCGVDSFQLVRTAGGWKIVYIIDTRRKTGCAL